MTASRRSLVRAAAGWSTFVVITLLAGAGPLFETRLSAAVLVTISVTTAGLAVSIAQRQPGEWSLAPLVAAPALAVPLAATLEAPSARTLALALTPLTIAGLAVWQRPGTRSTAWLLTGAALLAVVVDLAFRDPYRELNCRPVCPVSPWAVDHRAGLLEVTGWMLLAVVVVCSAIIMRDAVRDSASGRTLPATLIVGGLLTSAIARAVRDDYRPAEPIVSSLAAATLLCVSSLAATGLWPSIRSYLDRRRVRRWLLAVDGAAHGQGVVELLREAAGDPQLELVDGSDPQAGRVVTTLRRSGHPVAVIEHRPESADRLRAALSPTMIALIENEVLVATAARQLEELRAARCEAIERTDNARRELQRNLHDGAQQHLLVLAMALSALAADSDPPHDVALRDAVAHASRALERLRAVAHASTPPVLDDIGLDDALRSLAEACVIDVDLHLSAAPEGRLRPEVERAAYLMVADTVDRAAELGAPNLTVRLERDRGLVVTAAHPATGAPAQPLDADRIESAGGTFAASLESGCAVYRARFP